MDYLYIVDENAKWYDHSGKHLAVSYKTKHTTTIQSRNCNPGHLSPKNKNLALHKNLSWMFVAYLLVIVQNSKKQHPSTSKWLNKLWNICTMDYFSLIKRNKLLTYTTTKIFLERIMLSEKCQHSLIYYVISFI